MSKSLIREPNTLSELQSMSGDEIRRIDAYCNSNGDIEISKFMRGIIRLVDKERSWQGKEKSDSVRGLWYNPVKPVAQKALSHWIDSGRIESPFNEYMAGKLSTYLSNLVKNESTGITYRGLNIYDKSRDRTIKTTGIESDKILFAEKDVAYRKVKPLSETYELSVVSGSGYSSTASIEVISNELNPHKNYRLFVLSDYDPNGFKIADDFSKRAGEMGINILDVSRVAIDPDQVDDKTISQQKFKLPKGDQDWSKAIDGKYGLELEAIGSGPQGGKKLRQVVVDGIQSEINERDRYERELSNKTENSFDFAPREVAEDAIEERLGRARRKLYDRLYNEAQDMIDGSDDIHYDQHGNLSINWEKAQQSNDPLLPEIPDDGDLHQSAVEGEDYSVRSGSQKQEIMTRLESKIESGEIDVDEILFG
jgi:hypothetical protein